MKFIDKHGRVYDRYIEVVIVDVIEISGNIMEDVVKEYEREKLNDSIEYGLESIFGPLFRRKKR